MICVSIRLGVQLHDFLSSPMLTKVFWIFLLAPCCLKKLNASESRWENIALNKPCNMSSNYNTVNTCKAAINNNTTTSFQWTSPGNCIHTAFSDPYPHWTVDLGQFYTISQITIFAREDFDTLRRMTAVSVSVDLQPVYMFPNTTSSLQTKTTICPSSISQTQSTGCSVISALMPATGRTVTLARHEKPDDGSNAVFLNVCEVQVWVCLDGYYGVDCSNKCGIGCKDTCNKVNGTCTCQSGWKSPLCEVCNEGRYGPSCSNSCGAGCTGGTQCNNVTGQCSCKHDGWKAPLCQVCNEGKYGSDCNNSCGAGCVGGTHCDNVIGNCSCKHNGWKSPLCQVCREGTYGPDCSNSCGAGCDGGICAVAHSNNSTCYTPCTVTGECSCKHDGWISPWCQVCREGRYGPYCNSCGSGCAGGSQCDNVIGNCSCKHDGWKSPLCQDCQATLWGTNCSLVCGQCGGDRSCHVTTGHCLSGDCLFGWQGLQCLQTVQASTNDNGPIIGSVVGVGLFIGVAVIIHAVVLRLRRSRDSRHQNQSALNRNSAHCGSTGSELQTGSCSDIIPNNSRDNVIGYYNIQDRGVYDQLTVTYQNTGQDADQPYVQLSGGQAESTKVDCK